MSCKISLYLKIVASMVTCLALSPSPLMAKERDFCANRPGLDTPSCTLDPGQAMVEIGLAQWDHSADSSSVQDTLVLGDATIRLGLTERTELQVGLTSWVHDRSRDRTSGQISSVSGMGDTTIALRRGIAGSNGPIAIEPFVTLPTGNGPGGAGDWGAGLIVPMGWNLSHGFQLAMSPEFDVAVNSTGHGRHLAYGTAFGLTHALARDLTLTVETSLLQDEDPSGHATQARAASSIAWQLGANTQVDLELDMRLAGPVPDRSLLLGFAKRFP